MKTIFVFCPANFSTGGPELLHQLCFQLRQIGYDSKMMYVDYNPRLHDSPVCDNYSHYHNPYVTKYIDTKDNICILPEVFSSFFFHIHKGVKVLWWLSVDNFYVSIGIRRENIFLQLLKHPILYNTFMFCGMFIHKIYDVRKSDINFHLVQSYYALSHCEKIGISPNKIFYLSDYINDEYIKNSKGNVYEGKENIVIYNPKKGYKYTKLLMKRAPEITWCPLIDMTCDQISELMRKSKVYIDFGNHPGKDRLPREAAVYGCCIITGRKGSAAYFRDVPIPNEFKFDEIHVDDIIHKIKYIFEHYDVEQKKFKQYRNLIKAEKGKFLKDVERIFPLLIQ